LADLDHIKAKYVLSSHELEAPMPANQQVGEVELYDKDKLIARSPLVTLEAVEKGGIFSRMSDYLHHVL